MVVKTSYQALSSVFTIQYFEESTTIIFPVALSLKECCIAGSKYFEAGFLLLEMSYKFLEGPWTIKKLKIV